MQKLDFSNPVVIVAGTLVVAVVIGGVVAGPDMYRSSQPPVYVEVTPLPKAKPRVVVVATAAPEPTFPPVQIGPPPGFRTPKPHNAGVVVARAPASRIAESPAVGEPSLPDEDNDKDMPPVGYWMVTKPTITESFYIGTDKGWCGMAADLRAEDSPGYCRVDLLDTNGNLIRTVATATSAFNKDFELAGHSAYRLKITTQNFMCGAKVCELSDSPSAFTGSSGGSSSSLSRSTRAPSEIASGSREVWVNNKTHVYHFPGCRWYGNTVEGHYASAAEARAEGATLDEKE